MNSRNNVKYHLWLTFVRLVRHPFPPLPFNQMENRWRPLIKMQKIFGTWMSFTKGGGSSSSPTMTLFYLRSVHSAIIMTDTRWQLYSYIHSGSKNWNNLFSHSVWPFQASDFGACKNNPQNICACCCFFWHPKWIIHMKKILSKCSPSCTKHFEPNHSFGDICSGGEI